jgi:hypothetical protein
LRGIWRRSWGLGYYLCLFLIVNYFVLVYGELDQYDNSSFNVPASCRDRCSSSSRAAHPIVVYMTTTQQGLHPTFATSHNNEE